MIGDRTFAVVDVPFVVHQLGWPHRAQAYYKSTGTSNEDVTNFADVFFPTNGVMIHPYLGWITKVEAPEHSWLPAYCTRLDVDLQHQKLYTPPIVRSYRSRTKKIVWTGTNCATLMQPFLSRFEFWWQVQQSAALGTSQTWIAALSGIQNDKENEEHGGTLVGDDAVDEEKQNREEKKKKQKKQALQLKHTQSVTMKHLHEFALTHDWVAADEKDQLAQTSRGYFVDRDVRVAPVRLAENCERVDSKVLTRRLGESEADFEKALIAQERKEALETNELLIRHGANVVVGQKFGK